jgi:chaperonin cofactor prefoldin
VRGVRSTRVLALFTFGLAVAPAGIASAGGSFLVPPEKTHLVGDRVRAGTPFGGGSYEGKVSDGPFTVYLVPDGRRVPRNGGSVPAWAVPLGELQIMRTPGLVASISFTVPDVPAGSYNLDYCNVPCTIDGVGDLTGAGWPFAVGATLVEARLGARVDKLELDIERLEHRADRAQRLAGEVREGDRRERDLEQQVTGLIAFTDELRSRMGDLRSKLRAARAGAGRPPGILPIALIVITGRSVAARRAGSPGQKAVDPGPKRSSSGSTPGATGADRDRESIGV